MLYFFVYRHDVKVKLIAFANSGVILIKN